MLGPFEILEPIGAGGMGTVFKGRHRRTGVSVALKVLRGELADNREYLDGFHREVRATARMVHPGIVDVYDHGVVSPQAADEVSELTVGAPWLAMEFAADGSLEESVDSISWAKLRRLLFDILDALAHAHARGLVHRDLKPGNVLRRPDPGADSKGKPAMRWMLTDFGIAHVRDPSVSERTADVQSVSAGTPVFMAPEQFEGQWRDYGPWTDLYALGCLAFLLATGRAPFEGDSVWAIAIKQMQEPVPPFEPLLAVPDEFEAWIRRLLTKEISGRYRRAADAASDLEKLDAPQKPAEQADATQAFADTKTLATFGDLADVRTRLLDSDYLREKLDADRQRLPDGADEPSNSESARTPVAPPPPPSWHSLEAPRSTGAMLGAGKGLFGLRRAPFVGRQKERNHLWNAFHRVCTDGRPRCVIIRGEAGLGKSQLIEWISTRTHELGAATTLEATHNPIMEPTEGLPRAFRTHLGATGLVGRPLFERLEEAHTTLLGDDPDSRHLAAVAEWMAPGSLNPSDTEIPPVELETMLERFIVAESLLRRIANTRPVVLGIDDGQWGQESLGFAHHLVASDADEQLPVLVVVAIRPDAVENRLVEREYLELLSDTDRTSILDLPPLDDADQETLVSHLLGLHPRLVARVRDHTGGNPLFASQLLEDWVDRDALCQSDRGYVLENEETLPERLSPLLERRIQRFIDHWRSPEDVAVALEAASALGVDVEDEEWTAVCAELGCAVDDALRDDLFDCGLSVPRDGGWRFRLSVFRDALENISKRTGRWRAVNTCCAEVLAQTAACSGRSCERRARHYLAASRPDEALPLLWEAADRRMKQSAYIQALAILELVEHCLETMDVSTEAADRARLAVRRAEAYRFRGDYDTAFSLLEQVVDWPSTLPAEIRAHAHRVFAGANVFQGHKDDARRHHLQALELFEEAEDHVGRTKVLHGLGWLNFLSGHLSKAREMFLSGFRCASFAGDDIEAAWCLHGVAQTHFVQSDPDGGEYVHRAMERFEARGCRSGMAFGYWMFGDYARLRGQLDEARRHYRRASHFASATGHILAPLADALPGYCDIAEEDYESARRHFQKLDAVGSDRLFPLFRPIATVGLLAAAAGLGDTERFDDLLDTADEKLDVDYFLISDLRRLIETAADSMEAGGDEARAERARDLLEYFQQK